MAAASAAGAFPRAGVLFAAGALARLLLLLWGLYQDATFEVPYTDVDYDVFTDAARFVARGASPYERTTYRYTPLLAFALLPNVLVHPAWGKVLFALFDLLAGALILRVLRAQGHRERACVAACAAWLFNPFTIAVSTRGSCESLPATLVLVALERIAAGRPAHAGLAHGAATHLRIVPVAYALPILVFLDAAYERDAAAAAAYSADAAVEREDPRRGRKTRPLAPSRTSSRTSSPPRPREDQKQKRKRAPLAVRARLAFAASSFATFAALGAVCFALYGAEFFEEAYAYHLSRRDVRHNFSPSFLPAYLNAAGTGGDSRGAYDPRDETPARSQPPAGVGDGVGDGVGGDVGGLALALARAALAALVAAGPQVAVVAALGVVAARDLPAALFLQTLGFVAFNAVVTAQYFVWYFSLAPLALPNALRTRGDARREKKSGKGGKTPFLPREDEDEEPPRSSSEPKWAAARACGAWQAAQAAWLAAAFGLEFRGAPRGFELAWLAGLGFLFANARAVAAFARALEGGALDRDAAALDRDVAALRGDAAALRGDAAALDSDASQRETA